MTAATQSHRWDPDILARLEHERDLLLRELRELDAQHAAGELDDLRYRALHDELTARAADAITVVERGKTTRPVRPSRPWARLVTAAGIAFAAIVAGLLLTDQLAPRVPPAPPVADDADGTERIARLTSVVEGDPDDVPARMALARLLLAEQDVAGARTQFDAAVELEPAHVEALTYGGWLATLAGDGEAGLDRLDRAVAADPAYPDAHALRGLTLMRAGSPDEAAAELRRYLELAPNGPLAARVETVVARLEAEP